MSVLYNGGIPYDFDIEKLFAAFPVPELTEGRNISHDGLSAVLGIGKSPRYYSIVNAWRKKARKNFRVIIEWRKSIGVIVLDPAATLAHREDGIQRSGVQFRRKVRGLADVDRNRLDSTGQKRHDHIAMFAARAAQFLDDTQKQMAVDLAPVASLPKRALILQPKTEAA